MGDTRDDHEPEDCPLPTRSEAPVDEIMTDLFASATTVAVVGASPRDHRTSHHIATWLMDHTPYEVFLVNPTAGTEEIRGHGFYSTIAELPVAPDIVDVFRRAEHTPGIATAATVAGASTLWLQLGIMNAEAESIATAGGLTVVQNRCIKVEYARLRDRIDRARPAALAERAS